MYYAILDVEPYVFTVSFNLDVGSDNRISQSDREALYFDSFIQEYNKARSPDKVLSQEHFEFSSLRINEGEEYHIGVDDTDPLGLPTSQVTVYGTVSCQMCLLRTTVLKATLL